MKQTFLTAATFALALSGCASPNAGTRTIAGATAGAAVGALAGAALGGDAVTGAGLGAIAGGAAGAIAPRRIFQGRQYYRDTKGYCYYVDRDGHPHYDGTVRC